MAANNGDALGSLKAQLSSILALAGCDGPTSMWGVTLDPSSASTGLDAILRKFLDSKDGDVTAAAEQLVTTLKWRKDFKPEQAAREEFPDVLFGSLGKILPGSTERGEPVTLSLYGEVSKWKETFGDLPRFIRWRVGLMEKCLSRLDFSSGGATTVVQIQDYSGLSVFSGRDAASKAAAAESQRIFSEYYPGVLSVKYLVNLPQWAAFLANSVSGAKNDTKPVILGTKKADQYAALAKVMSDAVIPERYGGHGAEE